MAKIREMDLYPPIKSFLENQGYDVKSEIGAADVVAQRGQEAPLIVELKTGFSLALVHQCVERLRVTDHVYMAVAGGKGRRFYKSVQRMVVLCRRLGLGLITVRLSDGLVQVHCDPGAYAPRKSSAQKASLLREFVRRRGDPNTGGQGRAGLMTAYRQDALQLALYLSKQGICRGFEVARATGVEAATRMMRDNHYGWFERMGTGRYGLSALGAAEVEKRGGELEGGTGE